MPLIARTGSALERFQVVNALIWAVTILGAAVVVKASDEFLYLLLVLVAGSTLSWTAIWSMLVQGGTSARRAE